MRQCALVLLALLFVACGHGGSDAPENASDETGAKDPGRRWEALHKVGNWWSVSYRDQTFRYDVVSVIGSKATVTRVTVHPAFVRTAEPWEVNDKRVIEVRKPNYADDRWKSEDGAREIGRGEGMKGGMNCYWVEYEVTSPTAEPSAAPVVDKVWRMDSHGVVINATRNGEEFLIISERELN